MDTYVELQQSLESMRYQEAFCGVEKWQTLNFGGCSGAVPGSPMIKRFLDAREGISFIKKNGGKNLNTCGFYDTKVALKSGYRINGTTQCIGGMNIYAYDYFHPYDYMSGTLKQTEHTYSVHWFSGGWLDEDAQKMNEATVAEYDELYQKCIKE